MREVVKLGGWSVGSPEAIMTSGRLIQGMVESGQKPLLVVVSAMKTKEWGITDALINAAREVSLGAEKQDYVDDILGKYSESSAELGLNCGYLDEVSLRLNQGLDAIALAGRLTPELLDQVVYLGEFGNAEQVNLYLSKAGINSVARHPEDLEAVCDGNFGNAKLDFRYDLPIARKIKAETADVIVTDGFYYMTEDGKRATIGRGGSDKSAVDYAVRIGSPIVRIGGDTNGVMSADPKIVGHDIVKTVRTLSYEEAMACSAHGAKVLHPRAIHPILDRGLVIPIQIFNTFEQDGVSNKGKYTLISSDGETDPEEPVRIINCLKVPIVLTVTSHAMYDASGFNARYHTILGEHNAQTLVTFESYQTNTSLVMNKDVPTDEISRHMEALITKYGGQINEDSVVFDRHFSLVTLVGEGIRQVTGLSGRIGSVFGQNKIKISATTSAKDQICMPYLVEDPSAYDAVKRLHEEFFRR